MGCWLRWGPSSLGCARDFGSPAHTPANRLNFDSVPLRVTVLRMTDRDECGGTRRPSQWSRGRIDDCRFVPALIGQRTAHHIQKTPSFWGLSIRLSYIALQTLSARIVNIRSPLASTAI